MKLSIWFKCLIFFHLKLFIIQLYQLAAINVEYLSCKFKSYHLLLTMAT